MDDAEKTAAVKKAVDAFNWLVRVYAPAFLRMANLEEHAKTLAETLEIASAEQIDSHVSVRVNRVSEDMEKRRSFMLQDRIWHLLTECFGAGEIPGNMHMVATVVSTIADGAAKIAVASGSATAEKVSKTEGALERELTARLNSAS